MEPEFIPKETGQWTVHELLHALRLIPAKERGRPVVLEGCDCVEALGGIAIEPSEAVMLLRLDHMQSYRSDPTFLSDDSHPKTPG